MYGMRDIGVVQFIKFNQHSRHIISAMLFFNIFGNHIIE